MSYTEFLKRALTVFAMVVMALAFWRLRNTLMLAFLAVVISVSLSIPVSRLQRMGVRRGLAITTTLTGVFAAIFLFFLAILPMLVIQTSDLIAEFPDAYEQVREVYDNWYDGRSDTIKNVLPSLDDEQVNNILAEAGDLISPIITGTGTAIANILTNLIVVIVVSIFLLVDPKDYLRGAILLTPPQFRERALEIMAELKDALVGWMTALIFSISITTTLVWIMLGFVWGVPNSLALGVIAGIMTMIPNIGSIVPLVPIAIFTLADEPSKMPFVLLTYLAIQQLESNVMTPSIVRRELNIPAAMIFIFQLIFTSIFGFFGILLAVPLLATLITLVREIYVYDTLNQRGVRVDLEYTQYAGLRLVTSTEDPEGQVKVVTQTIELKPEVSQLPPEDMITNDGQH